MRLFSWESLSRTPCQVSLGLLIVPLLCVLLKRLWQTSVWRATCALLTMCVGYGVFSFGVAFVFRTTIAEAFKIPTGAMAPTVLGRHKDVVCPMCGYAYQISASGEVDSDGKPMSEANQVVQGTCPMCRFTANIGTENPQHRQYPSFNGDRILVSKLAYQVSKPGRWDLMVFKYPGDTKINFIKRVVGLPGETVRISHGDIFIKGPQQADFGIARKSPDELLAMLQPVYDNDYVLPRLIQQGWPARWQPAAAKEPGAWQTAADYRNFFTDGVAEGDVWIRYHHTPPTCEQWQRLERGVGPGPHLPRAQLITDFTAYNTDREARDAVDGNPDPNLDRLGLNWVGDLAVECRVTVRSPSGTLMLELIKGGRNFTCRIDAATGAARLVIDSLAAFRPTAKTPIRGPGIYRIMFSNVDEELRLWVDGKLIAFDGPTAYPHSNNIQPQAADLSPVGIGAHGAALEVEHVKIFRDLYYIAVPAALRQGMVAEYEPYSVIPASSMGPTPDDLARFFSDPRQWSVFGTIPPISSDLAAGQYLVLGDNSARSKDSRLWGREYYVARDLLIGKALFIYWPLDRMHEFQ